MENVIKDALLKYGIRGDVEYYIGTNLCTHPWTEIRGEIWYNIDNNITRNIFNPINQNIKPQAVRP